MTVKEFLKGLIISLLFFFGLWLVRGNYGVPGYEFLSSILPGGFLGLIFYCLYLAIFTSLIYFLLTKNLKKSLFFAVGIGLGFIIFLSIGISSLRNLVGGL